MDRGYNHHTLLGRWTAAGFHSVTRMMKSTTYAVVETKSALQRRDALSDDVSKLVNV